VRSRPRPAELVAGAGMIAGVTAIDAVGALAARAVHRRLAFGRV
jgi:hypothetical protein